jgi:FkbH-like protein
MFEFTAGFTRVEPDGPVFQDDLEHALGVALVRRSLTVWEEHCSECAMPSCYASCSFYTPRRDFKCRRFPGGVEILPGTAFTAAPMRIRFGKWARLLGYGPTALQLTDSALRKERRELKVAGALGAFPSLKGLVAPIARRRTNMLTRTQAWETDDIGRLFFVMQASNASQQPIPLNLSFRVVEPPPGTGQAIPFETTVSLAPGTTTRALPVSAFIAPAHVGSRFSMQIAPAVHDEHPQVTFGFLDVAELAGMPGSTVLIGPDRAGITPAKGEPTVKCVVWDLDNTLWDGVLIEDGLDGIRLRAGVVGTIRRLDRRGILQSVASKNDHDNAMAALEHFGLSEYFLHPQISWGPKSAAIAVIADALNIGIDTFAFVDDQEFERAEVRSRHPEVLVLEELSDHTLESAPRFQVEVTSEAASRRRMYVEEEERAAAAEALAPDSYEDFLRSCEMRIEISHLDPESTQRAYELAQRTNQLNIWTTRYTLSQIQDLVDGGSNRRAFTIRAADRFGSYGIVGLCVFEPEEALVLDLMMSCRIQGKLVGETFLAWLAASFSTPDRPLRARYQSTARNTPARNLLDAAGFRPRSERGDGEEWVRTDGARALDDLAEIIHVETPDA